jgi:hypothetical protein
MSRTRSPSSGSPSGDEPGLDPGIKEQMTVVRDNASRLPRSSAIS